MKLGYQYRVEHKTTIPYWVKANPNSININSIPWMWACRKWFFRKNFYSKKKKRRKTGKLFTQRIISNLQYNGEKFICMISSSLIRIIIICRSTKLYFEFETSQFRYDDQWFRFTSLPIISKQEHWILSHSKMGNFPQIHCPFFPLWPCGDGHII